MNANVLPSGVRLDEWPQSTEPTSESLTIAQLQGELRRSMPETAELLEAMKDVQLIQELVAQLFAPMQGHLVMTTSTLLGARPVVRKGQALFEAEVAG